ncbi:hypothetical protein GE09DRAFT_1186006 [Coniochaeta sp. 2T2.1]|nr:hypothetical protein GE09DRAFT_1186006 [Coniochaeta sp. 2T2.1]
MGAPRVVCPGAYPMFIDTEPANGLQKQQSDLAEENLRLREKLTKYEVALEVSQERYEALKNQKSFASPTVERSMRQNEDASRIEYLEDKIGALMREAKAHEDRDVRLNKEISYLRENIGDLLDQIQAYQKRDHASAQEIWWLRQDLEQAKPECAMAKGESKAATETVKTVMGGVTEDFFGLSPGPTDWVSFAKALAEPNTPALLGARNAIVWTIEPTTSAATRHLQPSILFPTEVQTTRLIPLRTLCLGLQAATDAEMTNPFNCPTLLKLLNTINKNLAVVQAVPTALLSTILRKLADCGNSRYGNGYGQHPVAMAVTLALVQSMSFLRGRFGIQTLKMAELEMRDLLRRAWPSFGDCVKLVQGVCHAEIQSFVDYHQKRYPGHVFEDRVILRDEEDTKYFVEVDCGSQTISVAPLERY